MLPRIFASNERLPVARAKHKSFVVVPMPLTRSPEATTASPRLPNDFPSLIRWPVYAGKGQCPLMVFDRLGVVAHSEVRVSQVS